MKKEYPDPDLLVEYESSLHNLIHVFLSWEPSKEVAQKMEELGGELIEILEKDPHTKLAFAKAWEQ